MMTSLNSGELPYCVQREAEPKQANVSITFCF